MDDLFAISDLANCLSYINRSIHGLNEDEL